MYYKVFLVLFFLFPFVFTHAQNHVPRTFRNPLLSSGADPWVIQKGGIYYVTYTSGNNIQIIATRKISELGKAKRVKIWTPPDSGRYSKEIWAPELHFIDRKWYIYFAADDGNNDNHRIYVLENGSMDPLSGRWTLKGKVSDSTDKWAIDASVFEYKGRNYIIWSGWEGNENISQNIYIARLSNPWTIEGRRALLSAPKYDWEKKGSGNGLPLVNEGPEILKGTNGQLFLTYSASGCWTDDYALGLLSLKKNGDPMKGEDWVKDKVPVFTQNIANGVYGPGHNGFFKSVDGKEDWIIYHANPEPHAGCGAMRSPRIQKINWNKDGSPDFGVPQQTGIPIIVPSGE